LVEEGLATINKVQLLAQLPSQRLKVISSDAYGLSFLLDRRYIGEDLPQENRIQLEQTNHILSDIRCCLLDDSDSSLSDSDKNNWSRTIKTFATILFNS